MTSTLAAEPVREGLFSVDPPTLLAGSCEACGTLHFPQRAICPACQSPSITAKALAHAGRIYTFTVVHAAPPGYLGETPYAVGIVDLPEGLRVTTTITADDLAQLQIGDAVEFELITLGAGSARVTSYAFRRSEEQR